MENCRSSENTPPEGNKIMGRFRVMYKKPVILLTTKEYENLKRYRFRSFGSIFTLNFGTMRLVC